MRALGQCECPTLGQIPQRAVSFGSHAISTLASALPGKSQGNLAASDNPYFTRLGEFNTLWLSQDPLRRQQEMVPDRS